MRRLNGDVIGHAILRIQPKIGGGLETPAQADEHALRDIFRRHPNLVDERAIHIQAKRGQAHHLLHVHIRSSRNEPQPVRDPLPDVVVCLHVRAHDLNIDRSRQSKIKDLRHDICGLKEELHTRKPRRKYAAQPPHVLRRRMMMFRIQRDQNLGVTRPNHARTAVGEVNARIRQPDVVEHGL